jgi:hypothetical protein
MGRAYSAQGKDANVYKRLNGRLKGRNHLTELDIDGCTKGILKVTQHDDVDLIQPIQDMVQWGTHVNIIMNLWVP